MNSGFMEIAKLDKFDCFVFHDVDLLPEDDRILYTCDKNGIKHLAYALQEWNYQRVVMIPAIIFSLSYLSTTVSLWV